MVRFKNRYFVVEIASARNKKLSALTPRDIQNLVLSSIANNFGDVGLGLMMQSLQVVYYNATTRLAVVRGSRDYATCIQACLTFITEAQHQDIKCETLQICGSSRTCKDSLLTLSNRQIVAGKLNPTIRTEIIQDIESKDL
ncbi:Aste57867_10582 [Aphanomyces stellatus]|uniref:Ribonuclease P/MRP protein subunit POP5 n=1 Tax=Aphanomyces stellatus TaxID=120398 RepID=A0A485KS96_9STRA|nr:hypothetical protein As57867_010542 [Aphanomyces stellatus]VFT87454.1 Aste57867_10582 [Aphanomyces stellatus]